MSITHQNRGAYTFIKLEGEIDMFAVAGIRQEIFDIIVMLNSTQVVLDCQGINRIDSAGIGLFIQLKITYKNKINFRIFGLQDSIRELFRITNLDNYIHIDVSENESVAAISVKP